MREKENILEMVVNEDEAFSGRTKFENMFKVSFFDKHFVEKHLKSSWKVKRKRNKEEKKRRREIRRFEREKERKQVENLLKLLWKMET